MLEHWYKSRRTLVDFRRGPLGPHFDGFAEFLMDLGYSRHIGTEILGKACLLNHYLIEEGVTKATEITRPLVGKFLEWHYADHRSTSPAYSAKGMTVVQFRRLFDYLEVIGVIKPIPPTQATIQYSWILKPYMRHLQRERELTDKTVKDCVKVASEFLASLGKEVDRKALKSMEAHTVETHVRTFFKESPANLRRLIARVRRFCNYCFAKGYMSSDFAGIFPSMPTYRYAKLPRGMADPELQKVLKVVSRNTVVGARDYAMMMLMMAYGLRAKSVAELLLDDINWERSTIRIAAQKGGKEVVMPLLESCAEAIVAYLRVRGRGLFRNVFLAAKAPHGPLNSVLIGSAVRRYMALAGVKKKGLGAYTFRHSWAIRALAHDSPIKSIADVLGHKSVNTSFIYAKADMKMLTQVAMPWPEERREI